jgi:hypothetical protein
VVQGCHVVFLSLEHVVFLSHPFTFCCSHLLPIHSVVFGLCGGANEGRQRRKSRSVRTNGRAWPEHYVLQGRYF